MGCTAGCLNITLNDKKHMELFAETFMEVMNEELYEPFEDKSEVLDLFDTDGDIEFALDAEPIFSFGHGYENVQDFLLEFIKKAPDVELSGDFYSDWDNCCDICCLQFEYKDNKLSVMRLFSEVFGVECEGCGAEVEMSDVEIYFDKERYPVCPECGARILGESSEGDEESYSVDVYDLILEDGEWVMPEGFDDCTEGDTYLTGIAPDEVTNAWKYEDELAVKGILPELPTGVASWEGLPRVHAAAEEGDEKAIELLAAIEAYEVMAAKKLSGEETDECGCDECEEAEEAEEISEETVTCEEVSSEEKAEESDKEEAAEIIPEKVEKKKSKWWIIPLIISVLALGAAAVQLLGVYNIIGFIKGML